MSSRIKTVILEVGLTWFKGGFAKDACPQVFLPTPVNIKEKPGRLCSFVKEVLLNHLFIRPVETQVIVCETAFAPRWLIEGVLSTLRLLGVRRVSYLIEEVCAAIAVSKLEEAKKISLPSRHRGTFLIVNSGWNHTDVVPVYAGSIIIGGMFGTKIGASTVSRHMWSLLKWRPICTSTEEATRVSKISPAPPAEPEDDMSLAKELLPFCIASFNRNSKISIESFKSIKTVTSDKKFSVEMPPNARIESSMAAIFGECDDADEDSPEESLVGTILESIQRCPLDTRRDLVSNILVVGGTWMIPGFIKAVYDGLVDGIKKTKISGLGKYLGFVDYTKVGYKPNTIGWAGASVLSFEEKAFVAAGSGWRNTMDEVAAVDWTSLDLSLNN